MEGEDYEGRGDVAQRELRDEPGCDVVVDLIWRWLVGLWVEEEGAEVAAAVWGVLVEKRMEEGGRGDVLFATVCNKLAVMNVR